MPRPGIPGTILATFVAALALVALSACQTDQVDDAVADTEMDAQHEEDDGDHELHWSYEGDTGPAMWGSLDPSFAACDDGVRQSPVDIVGATAGGGSELEIRWQPGDAEVVDNGHTIVVNVAEGSAISLEGREFTLLQFHFHLPSEHIVEGSASPMDIHFVHAAAEGDLAVIGVFMEAGEADATIQSIWEAIPAAGESPGALAAFDPRALLPEGGSHYRYPGFADDTALLGDRQLGRDDRSDRGFPGPGRRLRGSLSDECAPRAAAEGTHGRAEELTWADLRRARPQHPDRRSGPRGRAGPVALPPLHV